MLETENLIGGPTARGMDTLASMHTVEGFIPENELRSPPNLIQSTPLNRWDRYLKRPVP